MADDFEIGENADGKYFLIEVPNFNNGSDDPEDKRPKMSSYLRLGAVKDKSIAGKPDAPKESGEDLAFKARRPNTRIDGVTHPDGSPQRSLPYKTQDLVFEDDYRERDPAAPITNVIGDVLAPAELGVTLEAEAEELEGSRLGETALLHTKGGWRDHSDGNRITTTRGDKVEVIRGNYKLVVLGRQENIDNASGWDLSGGEIRGTTLNLGEFETTSVEWVEDDGGRWRVVEKNQKGDEFSIYWGDKHEEFFGEIKSDVTGSETPGAYPHKVPGVAPPSKVNPKIIERTWAESIEGYTGTTKLPVPWTKEVTWVSGDIYEETHAGTTTGLTVVTGAASETATLGSKTETTTVLGTVTETTSIGAAKIETTTVGGAIVETTAVGGAIVETKAVGGAIIETEVSPFKLETKASLLSIELAMSLLAIEIFLGLKVEIDLIPAKEIHLLEKEEVSTDKTEIALIKMEMAMTETRIITATEEICVSKMVLSSSILLM